MAKVRHEPSTLMTNSKYPKIERIENCITEIDWAKGNIKIQHNGRYHVVMKNIALYLLNQPTIELICDNEASGKIVRP